MTNEATTKQDYKMVLLSSGHKVFIKDKLTWKEEKDINNILFAKSKFHMDPVTKEQKSIETDPSAFGEMTEKQMLSLIAKIEDDKGNSVTVSASTLDKLDSIDVARIRKVTDEVAAEIKKKLEEINPTSET